MAIAVRIDSSEFEREKVFATNIQRQARGDMWRVLRGVALKVERNIKIKMPVDTGRARASWGHWSPQDLVTLESEATSLDSIWQEDENNLTLTQGTNVEYVAYLNEGHSSQAPAGFIETEVALVLQELSDLLGAEFVRSFEK